MTRSPITSGPLPDADHLPEGEEKVRAVRAMFDTIAPRYDLVNRVMTLRMDVGWRRSTVARLDLPAGSLVLDLACGTGDLCRELARSGHQAVGVDLSFGVLAAARTSAPLVHADILRLPLADASVDGVTCGFALRNLVDLGRFFVELARVIRPGGRVALLEVAEPPNPVLRWGHGVYFGRVVPRIGGLLSEASAYRYLPKSVAYLPPADRMLGLLADAGFNRARRDLLSIGVAQLITALVPDLVATTRRFDGEVDLVGYAGSEGMLFTRDGRGFATRGVAKRVALDQAAGVLAGIDVDDRVGLPGCGAVAFGALPFVADATAEVVIPERIVGRADDGTRWSTVIGPRGSAGGEADPVVVDATADAAAAAAEPLRPSRFEVSSSRSPEDWCGAVAEATARMRRGVLEKVVLAREVVVTADCPIPIAPLLRRLQAAYGGCFLYAVDGFVGASPELLVSRSGDIVRSQPMAGTTARRGDPQADARAAAALLASPTYRHEHQVTIDMVHDTLLEFSSYLDYEAEPTVVALANVAHLATMVEGRLSQPSASVLELVRALHPTPAVCGRPRDVALATIAELEHLDRGRYAGAVGWVDAAGNGQWAVSIRCAQIDGTTARVFAGNGIVADSDPHTELAETRAKLQALLGAIVRP